MRHVNAVLGMSFYFLWTSAALSQNVDKSIKVVTPDQSLPAAVVSAISLTTNIRTIFPITDTETFDGQILKADEIVFAPGSALVLSKIGAPWIAIVAKKWKFADSSIWSEIRFAKNSVQKIVNGTAGGRGSDRPGETNRTGNRGDNGGTGGTGKVGLSFSAPVIYIVAQEFDDPQGQPLPGSLKLKLNFRGFDGGQGGQGGRGGSGGNAGDGKEGSTSMFDCQEGPGPGGQGGDGGTGGAGGAGGAGGPGADIVYVSLANGIEQLSYARVYNMGGNGGQGGKPGGPGLPGGGGRGAPAHDFCGSSGDGPSGSSASPRDYGYGNDGNDGKKGTVYAVTVQSLTPLF